MGRKPTLRRVIFPDIKLDVTDRPSPLKDSNHLYLVAGYPTSGKSSSLWKSAQERYPLFGADNISVVPEYRAIRDIRENMGTKAKLKAGFWCTLADIPHLNEELRLPKRLILHLDLLLVYLLFRAPNKSIPEMTEIEAAFVRLFAQPALRRYEQYTVTTLCVPLEEIQRRWRYRYHAGVRPNHGRIIAEKDRLITDGDVAASVFAAIHGTWGRCLASLSRSGKLAEHFQARVRLHSEPPLHRSP